MGMHYGLVDIAIKQELRDRIGEAKGAKSYNVFLEELLEKQNQ